MILYVIFLPLHSQYFELIVALIPKKSFKNSLILLRAHGAPSQLRPTHTCGCTPQYGSTQPKEGVRQHQSPCPQEDERSDAKLLFPCPGRGHGVGPDGHTLLSMDATTELLSAALALKTSKIKLLS